VLVLLDSGARPHLQQNRKRNLQPPHAGPTILTASIRHKLRTTCTRELYPLPAENAGVPHAHVLCLTEGTLWQLLKTMQYMHSMCVSSMADHEPNVERSYAAAQNTGPVIAQ
jgi:hypothetical protein